MSAGSATIPTLVSLLVCDQVIDDRLTNKKSAIGLFNTVVTRSVPTRLPQMSVMVAITEISGAVSIELRLTRDADNEVVLSTTGQVEAPSPLNIVDLVFALQGVHFARAGQYAFEVWAGAELLGRRRFHVVDGAT